MLVELGLVEQRHEAVLEVLAGTSVTQVALRYGVTRQTVHTWLGHYAARGLGGLVDHSSRPISCPHQMSPEVEARVIALRLDHPGWGPRTLRHQLEQEGREPVPSCSSLYRCLVRHDLILPRPRRRKREDYRRWERSRAMELWQMDVMGGVRLTDGAELKVVTGIDDHSRFCVSALLVTRATARPVCEALALALRRYGVPDQILSDNGKVFTGRFGPGKGEVLFDRICRENGIRHLLTAPRSPTTTGKVERFHKTLRREFLADRTFASLEEAQAELDGWVEHYNAERPHQGIGMVPPQKRFALARSEPVEKIASRPEESTTPAPGDRTVTRVVNPGGRISLANVRYPVGVWLTGETVQVTLRDNGLVEVCHRGVLIAAHARRHPVEAEPAILKRRQRRANSRPPEAPTVGIPVTRKVDGVGDLSFAAARYHVGIRYRREQLEVRVVGDTVEISKDGELLRTHRIKHDRDKEHAAFATPRGRPRRSDVAS
jgi:transposase InsO family protein